MLRQKIEKSAKLYNVNFIIFLRAYCPKIRQLAMELYGCGRGSAECERSVVASRKYADDGTSAHSFQYGLGGPSYGHGLLGHVQGFQEKQFEVKIVRNISPLFPPEK